MNVLTAQPSTIKQVLDHGLNHFYVEHDKLEKPIRVYLNPSNGNEYWICTINGKRLYISSYWSLNLQTIIDKISACFPEIEF